MLFKHKSSGPNSDKITAAIIGRVNANKRNANSYNRKHKVQKRNESKNRQPDERTPNNNSSSFFHEEPFSSSTTTNTPSDLTGDSFYQNNDEECGENINHQESDSITDDIYFTNYNNR